MKFKIKSIIKESVPYKAPKDDRDNIELFISSHPRFQDASPRHIKSAVDYVFDEWLNVKDSYDSINDYFDELENTGGLENIFEGPSIDTSNFKELMLMIIDQNIWRGKEWGADLVQGQFEYCKVPFTEENIRAFFEWAQSEDGRSAFNEIVTEDEGYLEWFSPDMDESEAEDIAYQEDEFGMFSTASMNDEIARLK